MFKKLGITGKFITLISVVTIVLLTFIALSIISTARKYQAQQAEASINLFKDEQAHEKKLLRDGLLRKGKSMAALMAQTAVGSIIGYDFDALEEVAKSAAADPDIEFVTFYDKDKKPITSQASEHEGLETIRQKIMFDKEAIGSVEVGINLDFVKKNAAQIQSHIETLTTQAAEANAEASRAIMYRVVIFAAAGVFLLCVIVYWSFRAIVIKPISGVVAGLKDIAEGEGDLTKRLEASSKDELGDLARWFNTFLEKLQRIIKDIAGNAETLAESSTELSSISKQLSSGTEQTSAKANTVAAAAEEMSSNMTSVAAATEQASTNVGTVATAAEQMTGTINEIAKNTEKAQAITGEAVSQAKSASGKVDELGQAAKEISKVTETITEISEQTNLLALNATIEAARAGEAGKGFAVVANEIKELARQTASATGEIKEKIEGIQGSTEGTIGQIEQISKVINDVNEIVTTTATAVEEQSVTTKEIANNVAQASQGIAEVTENVAQSSTVAADIARDISDVNQAAGEMSNSSAQVNMSAQELSRLAATLMGMVSKFRFSDNGEKKEAENCVLLEKCGFFKKFGNNKDYMTQGFIELYCKGPKQNECVRKKYREEHGTPPSDDMMPTGEMMSQTS